MKRFISIILTTAFLAVPVYAQDTFTQEELVSRAKEVCSIGNYEDFSISSTQNPNNNTTLYLMEWSNNGNGYARITAGNDGTIYSYYEYLKSEESKSLCKDSQAKKTADSFIDKALGDKASDLKYDYCDYKNGDSYLFIYKIYENNIEIKENAYVMVNKFTNKVESFNYPDYIDEAEIDSLDSIKSLDEAKAKMNSGFKLGYLTNYDYDTKKLNIKPIYKFDNYTIDAKTLEPYQSYGYGYEKGSGSAELTAESNDTSLTPAESKEIENSKNVILPEKAISIANNAFGTNFAKEQFTANYAKDTITNEYQLALNFNNDTEYAYIVADNKGRILNYNHYKKNYEGAELSEDTISNMAENVINSLNSSAYELTPMEKEFEEDTYSYKCNLIRNGYISFDEQISVYINTKGSVVSANAQYFDDNEFNKNMPINITKAKALEIAYNNNEFKNYYAFTVDGNSAKATAVFAFNREFTIDADTGEILNINGEKLSNNSSLKEYTDINNQWYADTVREMAYMGYGYSDSQFNGEGDLTYKALNELLGYKYDANKKDNETITRYELAEIFMNMMNCNNATKYNEVYVKPFDDVEFKYTGAVAILKAAGIVKGDSFRGNENATRAEALVMYYRYLTKI